MKENQIQLGTFYSSKDYVIILENIPKSKYQLFKIEKRKEKNESYNPSKSKR